MLRWTRSSCWSHFLPCSPFSQPQTNEKCQLLPWLDMWRALNPGRGLAPPGTSPKDLHPKGLVPRVVLLDLSGRSLGHWEHAFPRDVGILFSSSLFWPLGHEAFVTPWAPHQKVLPFHRPKSMESTEDGLTIPKLWDKITLFLFKNWLFNFFNCSGKPTGCMSCSTLKKLAYEKRTFQMFSTTEENNFNQPGCIRVVKIVVFLWLSVCK